MSRYDYLEEVQKFNPYHGRDGRFSTADAATQFTWKPGQGVMYDNAIAREKQRTASMIPSRSVKGDPDTIAGVKRGEPMTMEQANEGHANPNYSKGGGYHVNCQSCVVAYEARLRGYDVQAKANTGGDITRSLARDTTVAWKESDGLKPNMLTNKEVTTAKRCKQWMEDTIQEGERYFFEHKWRGRFSAHIICADKDSSGALRMYDPQSGRKYQGAEIDRYLSGVQFKWRNRPSAKMLRVDDKALHGPVANGVMEAATHG